MSCSGEKAEIGFAKCGKALVPSKTYFVDAKGLVYDQDLKVVGEWITDEHGFNIKLYKYENSKS